MSEDTPSAGPTEPDEIRAEIEQTRADLADTVDALSNKVNVKARAGDKVAEAKAKVADGAARLEAKAPEPVQNALHATGDKVGPVAQKAVAQAKPYRKQIAIGTVVALVAVVVIRRRRSN